MNTDYKIDRFSNTSGSSFERARSVSRSRGQTAEERAFAEMKKMLASYEALTERLMTENASLKGRIDVLETDLHQFKEVHQEALNASQEELRLERETRQTFEKKMEKMEGELERSKEEVKTLRSQCASLNHEFFWHHHNDYGNPSVFLPWLKPSGSGYCQPNIHIK